MRTSRPGGCKLWAKGQHVQHWHRRHLVNQEPEQLQGGRVSPVQILPHCQDRVMLGRCHQPPDQGVLGLLPLPLGGQGKDG